MVADPFSQSGVKWAIHGVKVKLTRAENALGYTQIRKGHPGCRAEMDKKSLEL